VLESVLEGVQHHYHHSLRATAFKEPHVALTTLARPLAASRADGVSGYFRARVEIVVTIISE